MYLPDLCYTACLMTHDWRAAQGTLLRGAALQTTAAAEARENLKQVYRVSSRNKPVGPMEMFSCEPAPCMQLICTSGSSAEFCFEAPDLHRGLHRS